MKINLWIFPAADFDHWCKLVGDDGKLATHADYMAMIAAVQADQERQGHKVRRVGMRVASMQSALAARNLPNTPDNRALVIASEPTLKSRREWHFDFGIYRPDGQPVTELDCDELLEAITKWADSRDFAIGGGFGPFTKEK